MDRTERILVNSEAIAPRSPARPVAGGRGESSVFVVAAVHRDGASVRVVKPEDAPHRGGLAGTVGTQEAGDLAWLNAKRQLVDGGFLAVPLREALHLNH